MLEKVIRPSFTEVWLRVAKTVAVRSTCVRRQVGCVLTDEHNQVISTGYNGVASGVPHCLDVPCPGAYAKSGTQLEECYAIHAEGNALLQKKVSANEVYNCYTTVSPCVSCVKLLMNTGCTHLYFTEEYVKSVVSKELWLSKPGRTWNLIEID